MSWREGKSILALHRVWHRTSCEDRILGRHATRIAHVLMGKHKPTYHPAGDYVIVEDALKVRLTGKSAKEKTYFKHTGFPGSEKFIPISQIREKDPGEIIRRAVKGMLPKNRLQKQRLDRLRIFPEKAPAALLQNVLTTWRDPEVNAKREHARESTEEGVPLEHGAQTWGVLGQQKEPKWKTIMKAKSQSV